MREHPFAAGHDPRFLHSTAERDEALARLRHGLRGGESFLLVTGESGVGKTSLVLEALDDEGAAAAFVPQPTGPAELLEEICIRFEINVPKGASKPQAMSRLERHLAELRGKGLLPVLALDDAQDASPELMEELRMLANLEAEGRPMLQIVLMGLPELEQRLAAAELTRVRQRVATHVQLGPLSAEDTQGYLHARVAAAGGDGAALFPGETCAAIHRVTRGVPRGINTIAGEAMLKATRDSAQAVTPAHVSSVAGDSWPQADEPAPASGSEPPAAVPQPPADAAPETTPPAEAERTPVYVDAPAHGTSDAREWVARFVDPDKPLRIGGQIMAERAAEAARREWDETSGSMEAEEAPAAAAPPPPRRRRRPKPLPGSRRGTRRGARGRVPMAIGGLLVASVAMFLGIRWARRTPGGVTARPAATPVSSPAPEPAPPPASVVPAATRKRGPQATFPSAVTKGNPLAASGPGPGVQAAPTPAPARRGIETGSYLNAERAEAERTLLAETTGYPVRVIEGTEDGAPVYRVVVGSFGSRRKAQATLNDLVDRGLVEQAKVIALPESNSTAP